MLTPAIVDKFEPYLASGENIIWFGQPKQGLTFGARDIFLVPFSLMWGGFAIFWNFLVWFPPGNGSGDPGIFFHLWGLPFLVIGLYIILGRFWHDSSLRKRIYYAVSNKRIIILRTYRSTKIASLDRDRLPRLDLSEHRDGTGTIIFEASSVDPMMSMGFGWWVPSLAASMQFFRVAEPRRIYNIIRDRAPA